MTILFEVNVLPTIIQNHFVAIVSDKYNEIENELP